MGVIKESELRDKYDVIVIGSGLGGLTAAQVLAKMGRSVLVLEQHYQLGGLATWFKRPKKHIFDISLHGFPYGMIKSLRRYWSKEISDSVVPLKDIRFDNPQFQLNTTYDREDFKNILTDKFSLPRERVEAFFEKMARMNFYDDANLKTADFFEEYFPGRNDVTRLLMEPITYANGSTLDDPAISYGIVFSNFMKKGVYTYTGGTDVMIGKMTDELTKNGVDIAKRCLVKNIEVRQGRVCGVTVGNKNIQAGAVLSNAGLPGTIFGLVGEQHFSKDFIEEARAVRLNNSSAQVYMGIRQGEDIPNIGELFFTSTRDKFSSEALLDKKITSRTFSVYYPHLRPGLNHTAIVSSTNAKYEDWGDLPPEEYKKAKENLIEDTLVHLEKYIPDVRSGIDHIEAATPKTFKDYTLHAEGASFGTKFEGLKVSRELPEQLPGLYHAGSVGIIMSGWLGTVNYGVIVADQLDRFLGKSHIRKPLAPSEPQ